MEFVFLSLSPEFFQGFMNEGIIKKALVEKKISARVIDFRDFSVDKHNCVDDTPYGGGCGMLIKPDALVRAFESIELKPARKLILTSPAGKRFNQRYAESLAECEQLIFICGRYEGIDERVSELLQPEIISVGDYVLSNGELAALVIFNAVSRLIPGVLGNSGSLNEESFNDEKLEYPQYTRPEIYRNLCVPEVLKSGNHKLINDWRKNRSIEKTSQRLNMG